MLSLTPKRPRPSPSLASREQSLAAIPPTAGQAAAAHTNLGLLSSAFRATERAQYGQEGLLTEGLSRYYQSAGWLSPDLPVESPIREPDELNKLYPPPKGEEPFFAEAIADSLARVIHRQRLSEIASERTIARYNNARGFIPGLGVGFVGFLNDPLQAATSFVPGAGQVKFAQLLGKLGVGARTARVGGEVGAGAVAGGAAEAVLALAQQGISSHDVDALTTREVIERIFYGAAGNALFQGVAPAIGEGIDAFRARGRPRAAPERVEPARPVAPEAVARPAEAAPEVRPVEPSPEAPAVEVPAGGAALAEPAAGVTARFEGNPVEVPEFRAAIEAADQALPGEAGRAITDFVGHEPGKLAQVEASSDFTAAFGRMSPKQLEEAIATDAPIAREIETAFASVREQLRQIVGDEITLYRVQEQLKGDKPARNVLSWTADPKFAEGYAGARPVRPLLSEEQISAVEKEFAERGEVKIPTTSYTLRLKDGAVQIYTGKEHITDADSPRQLMEDVNQQRLEDIARNDKRRERIVTRQVPLDDILWITNRAGQSEFIVRNQGAAQLGPIPKMSAAQTQRSTVSAVASVLADEPVSVVGPRPTTPQSTLDAIEELNASRQQRPDPNLEAVAGIAKAAQAEAAGRPAPERGEAGGEARVEAPKVKETIQKQLTEIGVDSQQAEAAATLFDAFFRTMAARVGKTAQELYDESGLTFEKVTTAEGDFFQPAWHSSPHVFEQFSTDFMGAGEGAQMFGWGLYFSQKKGLYDHLRKSISDNFTLDGITTLPEDQRWIKALTSEVVKWNPGSKTKISAGPFLKRLDKEIETYTLARAQALNDPTTPGITAAYDATLASLTRVKTAIEQSGQKELTVDQPLGGRTFEVDVPDDDNLLLWDRPLSEQPQHVREAIEKLWAVIPGFDRGKLIGDDQLTGQLVYEGAVQDLETLKYTGELGEVERIWKEEFNTVQPAPATVAGSGVSPATVEVAQFALAENKQWGRHIDTIEKLVANLREAAALVKKNPNEFLGHAPSGPAVDALDLDSVTLYERAADELEVSPDAVLVPEVKAKPFRPDEFVSRFLLREGIEGHKYLDRGSRQQGEGTYNFVIYSGDKVRIRSFYQDSRGAIKFGEGKALISLFENSDPSTIIHEAGHFILETFIRLAKTEPKLAPDLAILQRQFDFTDTPSVKSHEDFASSWETYLRTGKAPSEELKSVFKLFKEWITEVYQRIKGKLPAINPEIRKLFDRMLAEPRSFGTPFEKPPPARLSDYTFKTSKGTEYEVRGSRTFRPDPRGDQLSDQTIYISPEDAKILRPLKLAKGTVSKLELRPDGKWGLKWIQGEKAGTWDEAISIAGKTEPTEGLVPVGLTKDGTYANIGTPIVEINKPLKTDPEMEALQRAVEELNLPPEELQAIMRDLEDYGTAQRAIPAAMTQAQQCLIEGGMF